MTTELEVVGVRVEYPANQPILLLREKAGRRYVPIWIAAAEATAIAYELQGVTPPRPLTHDLFLHLMALLGVSLAEVVLTGMEDGIYRSVLRFSSGVELDARPSDAVALALRAGCRISATEELVDQIGMDIAEEPSGQEDEVEAFREFLDQVDPEDFGR